MRNLHTMIVLAEHSEHRNVRLCMQCLLWDNGPETSRHLWECPVQSHEWRPARQRLAPAHVAEHLCRATSIIGVTMGLRDPRAVVVGHRDTVPLDSLHESALGATGHYGMGIASTSTAPAGGAAGIPRAALS